MPNFRFPAVPLRYLLIGLTVSLAAAPSASAQRGGGRGSGGGGGGAPMSTQKTPAQRVKEELKDTDPIEFINDHSKPLALEKEQKESFKKLHKEMQEEQKPIFKELDKMFAESERNGGGGGGFPGGSGAAGTPRGENGGGGGGGAPASPIRMLTARLMEVQESYGEKANLLLTESQRHMNDSLSTIYKAELRDKQAKARGRGRG